MMKRLFFLLYDGIENSVFESQVLTPLIKKLEQNNTLIIHIISFEKMLPPKDIITTIQNQHPRLVLSCIKRTRFYGIISLWALLHKAQKVIKKDTNTYCIARGVFAGYIALKLFTSNKVTIQARGIVHQEYAYYTNSTNLLHTLRIWHYYFFEKKVYNMTQQIEAVSPALKNYIFTTFKVSKKTIFSIAVDDIPEKISQTKHQQWRTTIRKKYGLQNRYVYVYSGSYKPWQCPQEIITYFKQVPEHNKFLLIFTQDKNLFKNLAKKNGLTTNHYLIETVKPKEIILYLCAADCGILLRKPHPVNWTARPTKALEYQAAHLPMYHNNTVQYLL